MVFGNLKSANDCPFSHLFVVYEWHGEQRTFLLTSPLIPVLRERLVDRLAPLMYVHMDETHTARILHIDDIIISLDDGMFDVFSLRDRFGFHLTVYGQGDGKEHGAGAENVHQGLTVA